MTFKPTARFGGASVPRRAVLAGALSLSAAGLPFARARAAAAGLDPVNPDLRFGHTGYLWGTDLDRAITTVAKVGLEGLEPYRQHIMPWVSNPLPLKAKFDAAGVAFITCSNGGPGQSTNFLDPAVTPKTIADHMQFAREFLVPFQTDVWKINVGARPPGGPTPAQVDHMAATLDELGRQLLPLGIRLAPHPHIWGPLEREWEVRRVMEKTDPRYVWLTMDTAHLTLGGMDAAAIINDLFPRVAEIHLKDCEAQYRGNSETPSREVHQKANIYKNMGVGGGVDFPAVFKVLRDRRFKGWVALDFDPPREGDGTGDIDQNLAVNINYLRDVIGLRLPPIRA
jgi:sugar phosphate isomerase/epimerase